MTRTLRCELLLAACVAMVSLVGCAAEERSEQKPAPPSPPAPMASDETSEEQGEIEEALAKLSADDRALAEKQKTCPVSGEPLGSMGVPIKVTVEGRDVLVCCEGCVDEVKNNFAKYEAKLPEA